MEIQSEIYLGAQELKPTADTYFFIQPDDAHSGKFILRNDEFKHAVKVLRLKEGNIVCGVNGEGTEYLGDIIEISGANKLIRCREISKRRMTNEPVSDVTLIQAPVKGDRTDYLVEKAVEIGVNRIIPVHTERTIIKVSSQRTTRWRRIALSGMKQSGRSVLPDIEDAISWQEAVSRSFGPVQKLILHKDGNTALANLIADSDSRARYVIAVGPEGDFTETELNIAQENGFKKVSLGPRRLRSETAGLVALAQIIAGQ